MDYELNTVSIRSIPEEESLRLLFYHGGKRFDFNRKKREETKKTLQRILLKLQPKQNKKKSKIVESSESLSNVQVQKFNVILVDDEENLIDENKTNEEAFVNGNILLINNFSYKLVLNPPSVLQLSLPTSIMAGFFVFPDVQLEFCNVQESKFYWYLSSHRDHKSKDNVWKLVGEDFTYLPSVNDISYYIKCLCIPGGVADDVCPEEIVSLEPISAGPGICLFDQRHLYTQAFLGPNEFRVASYNILADVFAESDFAKEVLYPYCPEYVIKSSYRRQLIIKELIGYHADIICLQECQSSMYETYLKPILEMNGYKGYLTLKLGEMPEGEALFFNSQKFTHEKDWSISVRDALYLECNKELLSELVEDPAFLEAVHKKTAVGQIHLLREKNETERLLVVLNTHLYYKRFSQRVRLIQISVLMNYLHRILQDEGKDVSVLLCGDLNSLVEDELLCYLNGEKIDSANPVWYINEGDGSQVEDNNMFTTNLTCPIPLQNKSGFPPFTSYVPHCKTTLDYVFSVAKIERTGFIPLPKASDIDPYVGLPCVVSGSDHLALVLDMMWK